jgi:aminopeptidase N
MMKRLSLILILSVFVIAVSAQGNIDVQHYKFSFELNDNNDTIYGKAEIKIKFPGTLSTVPLDIVLQDNRGKGMVIDQVSVNGISQRGYTAEKEKIIIPLISGISVPGENRTIDSATISISYHGIPADGLIISKNKFGHRTFFADNWPNRAHNWLPCKDDPSDKASVEFIVTAPSHYQVVSNGVLIAESDLPGNKKLTHWKEDVPLPTKIMVIGVAGFAVDSVGKVNNVPVSSWVFPENKKEGFYDYAQAMDILPFFMNYIGPYPYKKLANVQSKTIYGGMENAGAIFYDENLVTGDRSEESLLAHEIVHQWFGDMATEKSFPHLWLSEGFATYLTHVFMESKYGTDSLNARMKEDRGKIIDFAIESGHPVVDSVSSYKNLLNPNSYQKGGWVLHMLRRQLGDTVFHKIIRNYYAAYAGKNADTRDFQLICEKESGKNLSSFFDQWLYTPGLPRLTVEWKYLEKDKSIIITVKQFQKKMFQFPLEIQLQAASGKSQWETLSVTRQTQQFSIPVKEKTVEIYLDTKTSLLFEGSVSSRN